MNALRRVVPPALFLLLVCVFASTGCRPSKKIKTEVSPKLLAARTADFDELLEIVNRYEKIYDLKSSGMKVTLTSGKWESGLQEKYMGAPGYVLLMRPASLHMVIQNPVLYKTAIVEVVSAGDEFSAWLRDTNRVYKGRNSARELVSDDLPNGLPLRPSHLYDAFIPMGIDLNEPGTRISLEESADKIAKYYILSVYMEERPPLIQVVRRIWIERSELVLSRVQSFDENGRLTANVAYSEITSVDGFSLPLKIDVERPEDGYSVALEFTNGSWSVNSGLDEGGFVLPPREGTEVVLLREK
jgi:hypothetical protein